MLDEVVFKSFYFYIEYASFIFALFYFKKFKGYSFYKYFVFYLFSIIAFSFLSKSEINKDWIEPVNSGIEVLNIFTFFEFNLIFLIYFNLIEKKESIKMLKILWVIFNFIYFASFIYTDLSKYTVSLEGVFNSIFIIIYFRELLNSEKILNYKKLLSFWMSVGFLLFYLASVPFFTLFYTKIFDSRIMFPILYSLIIVFHSCFIYGIVTCKKEKD